MQILLRSGFGAGPVGQQCPLPGVLAAGGESSGPGTNRGDPYGSCPGSASQFTALAA